VSSNPAHSSGVYFIQHYVITFVSDLRQVGGFFPCAAVSFINKTDSPDIAEIMLKVALHTITLNHTHFYDQRYQLNGILKNLKHVGFFSIHIHYYHVITQHWWQRCTSKHLSKREMKSINWKSILKDYVEDYARHWEKTSGYPLQMGNGYEVHNSYDWND